MEQIPKTRKKVKIGGGSKKGRQMAHNQASGRYVRQRTRTERNKARARQKHLENHPNDLQAQIALR